MCPESLKTHHAVPLFPLRRNTLIPAGVPDLRPRPPQEARRPQRRGLCFRAGLRSVRGGFNCHPVQAELQPLVPFASTVSGAVHQLQKALDPDAGILADLRVCPAPMQPFPMPRPQNTVCDRYPGARSIRPDRRIHRGLACDSFSAEGHWSPDRKHGLLPYNSFLPQGQYLYIKNASKATDTQYGYSRPTDTCVQT